MTHAHNHLSDTSLEDKGEVAEPNQNELQYSKRPGWLRTIEGGWVGVTVSPLNEAIRLGLFAATLKLTKDPNITALAYGTSTVALEGSGAAATADILDSAKSHKAVDWVNKKLNKIGVSPEARTNKPLKAGIAAVGGTSVLLLVKQREEPDRSLRENLEYGGITSTALGAICTAQAYAAAEGINAPSPERVGIGLFAVGSLFAVNSWVKKRIKNQKEPLVVDTEPNNE
jgi:hypothetical protein